MFGFRERPPGPVHYRELFASKEFLELRVLIEKVLGIRDISLVREIHLRSERRVVDLAVSFTALRDAQESYIGLILVLEDLSNLIKAQKVAAWREVARRIAHEIKNPLTPIQLSAQRILKKWRSGDPEVGRVIEECTETITQYVDGLKTLVNEFSRFARMPPVAPVPTQLDKVIHNALVLYEGVHAKLTIVRQIAPDLPTLNLDPEQMKRVLINLVDNAIHSQNGEGTITVSASYNPRTQSARVEVVDEGPGIPPEDREKLFVPYFSTKPGGTGLGLAIVHRIVSDHHGTLRVEENVPHGTRFVIELPA
jgi:two-component system nitrogen regulation sensor histidine kinase NtrY